MKTWDTQNEWKVWVPLTNHSYLSNSLLNTKTKPITTLSLLGKVVKVSHLQKGCAIKTITV